MTISRFITCLAALCCVFAASLRPASAQQPPPCQYYQVNAPSLNVFSQPRADSSFVAALGKNDFICVVGEQAVQGDRTWVHITAKLAPQSQRTAMDGWAIKSGLQPAAQADIAALTSAPPAAAPKLPSAPAASNVAAPPVASGAQAPALGQGVVTFTGKITEGPTPVNGASLEQLINGVPEFPPIEGLPDAVWKKTCNNCHQWNQQSLCVQAKLYAKDPKMTMRIQHPYGGPEKIAMMKWAQGGCR
jgi:hypothetical protein